MRSFFVSGSLWLALGALAFAGFSRAGEGGLKDFGKERCPIVLILADDLGCADLGCYGSPLKNTPHIDKLAAEGIRFMRAYAAGPVCSPSRAAIMSGQSPARLHLTDFIPGRRVMPSQKMLKPDMRMELPLEVETLPEQLKKRGYACGAFGKWHLGGKGFGPLQQGFDHYFAGDATTTPGADEGGKGEYELTRNACAWIEQHKDEPFFCFLAHNTPHIPLGAKKELVEKYQKAGAKNPTYAAMMESMDDCVGMVLAKLDALKLAEKTLVVFLSDNGGLSVVEGVNTPATSNAPARGGKGGLYEGGLRIPLIMRWPGRITHSGFALHPIIATDLCPTLLEVAGATPSLQPLDGHSFFREIVANWSGGRSPLFWHYPHYSNQRGFPGGAMRLGTWKLIENYDDGHFELYDLAADPSESKNLAAEQPDRVKSMAESLSEWRVKNGAQMMKGPNPDYDAGAEWTQLFQNPQGALNLHASNAEVHGKTLCYEPQPKKNTLGCWTNPAEWASWGIFVDRSGEFRIIARYGCGDDSGGSEVVFSVAGKDFPFTVKATGGFQKWIETEIGTATLPAGRHSFSIRAKSKKGPAVMDVQQVRVEPVR